MQKNQAEWARASADQAVGYSKELHEDGDHGRAAHVLGIAGLKYGEGLYNDILSLPYSLRERISGE